MASHASLEPDATSAAHPTGTPGRLVTDAPTRMFHWLFAVSFAGAWLTAESERWRLVHASLGYLFAALLGFRILYGLVGPRRARLGVLWGKVRSLPEWLRGLSRARSLTQLRLPQGLNHSMAAVIVLVLAVVVPLTLTGHATYEDWGFPLIGGDWLEELHEAFANLLLWAVGAHLALLLVLSLMRGQNQALPMLTGRIPGAGPSPVKHNHVWLAILLAVMAAVFFHWLIGSPFA
jgi:cytochrome b